MSQTAPERQLSNAEVAAMGDATPSQRAVLRELLQTRRYRIEWREKFFADVREAPGLSCAHATSVTNFLRRQPYLDGQPPGASDEQATEIRDLLRTRVAPSMWANRIAVRLDAGTLTVDEADLALIDLRRLPERAHPAPAGGAHPSTVADGYYSLVSPGGGVRHYRVTTQLGGTKVVNRVRNGRVRNRVTAAWEVADVLRRIAAEPGEATVRYARETRHCAMIGCNRPLHDDTQPGWEHGYGPDCWTKMQAARKIAEHAATIPDDDGGQP